MTRIYLPSLLIIRDIYRLPIRILQKAKVAKLLLAANRGGMLSAESLEQELNSDSVVSLEEEIPADEDVAVEAPEAAVANDHSADISQGTSAAGNSASCSNSKKTEIPAAAGRRVHSERRTWNDGEITAVRRQLQSNIMTRSCM